MPGFGVPCFNFIPCLLALPMALCTIRFVSFLSKRVVVMSAKNKKIRICNMMIKNSVLPADFDGKEMIGNK